MAQNALAYPSQMNVSKRQAPVVNNLADTLDTAKAIALAISDNAYDDGHGLPPELIAGFAADLAFILVCLERNQNSL